MNTPITNLGQVKVALEAGQNADEVFASYYDSQEPESMKKIREQFLKSIPLFEQAGNHKVVANWRKQVQYIDEALSRRAGAQADATSGQAR
ncbi:hypothetical protein [Hymenobacter jeollabukensis]|uniref:Uncharacterized protein n=1 Tax=Hymenobacter jeollabukensis TaxID=2025313 RepID=A0A5R8WIW7_9BACT|nr:hypothetical protein [Hymenobacter jeollabukensis]TLM88816.1 hypothetical protein FDY95_23565 [Hymenobacter jeollabukensis]